MNVRLIYQLKAVSQRNRKQRPSNSQPSRRPSFTLRIEDEDGKTVTTEAGIRNRCRAARMPLRAN
jgi:hypothetical protein